MNAQSRGSVSLNSNRPEDPPAIDLNFLSAPYDLRVVSEAVKKVTELLQQNGVLEIDGPLAPGPRSLEEDDVLVSLLSLSALLRTLRLKLTLPQAFVRAQLGHLWHAAGTVRMGKAGAEGTCVTPDFKVVGVDRLRVADLSILSVMPR
jgi:choline dehydrogenase-like flavoprotein